MDYSALNPGKDGEIMNRFETATQQNRPLMRGRTLRLSASAAMLLLAGSGLLIDNAAAQGIVVSDLGGAGGPGGATGAALGGSATGDAGTGGPATAGDNEVANGGAGAGGPGSGGPGVSGSANGGGGEAGALISIEPAAAIVTSGNGEHGVSATSVGGNGGAGGTSGDATGGAGIGGTGTGGAATAGANGTANGGDGRGGNGFGGNARSGDANGGAGGDGGAIVLRNSNGIVTSGDGAHGLNAVSTGGNGGAGGTSGDATGGAGTGGAGTGGAATAGANGTANGGDGFGGDGFGGDARSGDANGGRGGDGGAITIVNDGDIATSGQGSHGISAVSAGGTGGAGGITGAVTGGAGEGGNGTGGTATTTGTPNQGSGTPGDTTGGQAASGSANGGDGGAGGLISIESGGTIAASGLNSHGIFAQSLGGKVNVSLTGGRVTGGLGTGAGVFISSGESTLTVGADARLSALSGLAIQTVGGNAAIGNFGLVEGNVALAGSGNVFNNWAGGAFHAGATVDLGAGVLNNAGLFSPGGTGNVITTNISGNFVQSAGGGFLIDANFAAGSNDLIAISGNADLGGFAAVNLLSLDHANQTLTVLTSTNPLVYSGIAMQDTPVVDYTLIENADSLAIRIEGIDFLASGLGRNQRGLGDYLNEIFLAGGGALDPTLLALANFQTLASYGAALVSLSPEPYLAVVTSHRQAARRFADALMDGCDANLSITFIDGRCVWTRIGGSVYGQDAEFDRIGIEELSGTLATGVEASFASRWTAGAAIAYDVSTTDVPDYAAISTHRLEAGLKADWENGPFLVGFGAYAGYGWSDSRRFAGPDGSGLARADFNSYFAGGQARIAYRFDAAPWTVTPHLDLDVTHVHLDGVSESGAGPLALTTRSVSETFVTLRPGVEFATARDLASGGVMRSRLLAGLAWTPDTESSVSAVFAGAPGGIPAFVVASGTDELVGEFGAGVEVSGFGNARLTLDYGLQLGASSVEHRATAGFNLKF